MTSRAPTEADWFERWFDQDYLRVYQHRDERDAAAGVALLERTVAPERRARMLDLACGAGRHLALLNDRGPEVIGLDLSSTLLGEARRRLGTAAPLIRADMRRLPFADSSFGVVTSFFTSFGYFDDDANAATLAEIVRVLDAGGTLLLDVLNRPHAIRHLPPDGVREIDGATVHEARRWDPQTHRIEKTIELTSAGRVRSQLESVRVYDAAELDALLVQAGLSVTSRFGDLHGAPFHAVDSPRQVVFGRRS